MKCTKCGAALDEGATACSACGAPVEAGQEAAMQPPVGFPMGQPGPANAAQGTLVISWKRHAMLIDFGTQIFLDGTLVKEVFCANSEEIVIPVWPGNHLLQASISGLRNTKLDVTVGAGETLPLDLEYSRAWGSIKFTKGKGKK